MGLSSVAALCGEVGSDVDVARFRPNIVLAGTAALEEDGWVGRRLTIGGGVLEVTMRSPRCVMIDMETADLPAQPGNLLAAGRLNEARLGIVARVLRPGRLSVDDPVRIG
jgi:uncharacterized protein YcbX